jgi:hypothetical protein
MFISSRTPEGTPNRCPVCNYRCWVIPSQRTRDAPCPRCGHLLWFKQPEEKSEDVLESRWEAVEEDSLVDETRPTFRRTRELTTEQLAALANRPKRVQNPPKQREPQTQATRLIHRLVHRGVERFGEPNTEVAIELASVVEPQQAERLLSLLPTVQSWGQLLADWHSEAAD